MYIGIINALEKENERVMKRSAVPIPHIPYRNTPAAAKKMSPSRTICTKVLLLNTLKEHGIIKPEHMSFSFFLKNITRLCGKRCSEICFGTKGVVALTGVPLHQYCKRN